MDDEIVSISKLVLMDVIALAIIWCGVIGVVFLTVNSVASIVSLVVGYYLSKLIITKKASLY